MLEINPSIAVHNGRIWCAYRTEHLFRYDAKSYISELDSELNVISNRRLIAENNNTAFEDVRLFSAGERLLAFYTYLPYSEASGWSWQFGVGFGEVDTVTGRIIDQVSLRNFSTRYHEKNWCPYIFKNELFLITDLDPYLRILKMGPVNGPYNIEEFYFAQTPTKPWPYGEIRGGTPLIQRPGSTDGSFYGFAHSFVRDVNGFERFYYYTALKFDHNTRSFEYHPVPMEHDTGENSGIYERLWYASNGKRLKVIFPIGIAHFANNIIVSFGIDDVSGYTQQFDWEYIHDLFMPTSIAASIQYTLDN